MLNAFLDIDDSILNRNLLLENQQEDELSKLLNSFEKPHVPFALVRPLPGVCAKMRTESGDKGFINICHTSEIPSPEDISDEKLMNTIAVSSEPSFVIPMSIGQERLEPDKGGALCHTYDIAISTQYFNKCQEKQMFMLFTLDIMIEAVNNKFEKMYKSDTALLLKNRKVIGKLQEHRIEKREIRKPQFPKKLIQEVENSPKNFKKTESISIPKESSTVANINDLKKPRIVSNSDYIILQKPSKGKAELLFGLFKLPTLISKDVSVDVGEDRIIVEVSEMNYIVDIFVPFLLDQEKVYAEMDCSLGTLRLNMPLKC